MFNISNKISLKKCVEPLNMTGTIGLSIYENYFTKIDFWGMPEINCEIIYYKQGSMGSKISSVNKKLKFDRDSFSVYSFRTTSCKINLKCI